jgi:hypothetical protein
MAAHTFTTMHYDDLDQKIANLLFQFKTNKIYAVERMNLDGLNKSSNFAEFYVESKVETRFRKKKTDQWQTLKDFWTADRMFARSCPHWERTSVSVTVGVGLRGDSIDKNDYNPIGQNLVTLSTWFDSKYKSQVDGIATRMVSSNYDETAEQVTAKWNDDCITNDMVETNALHNGIGIFTLLGKHLEQERIAHNKKVLDIFSKVKI